MGVLVLVAAVGTGEFLRLHPGLSPAARVCTAAGALVVFGAVVRLSHPPATFLIVLASAVLALGVAAHLAAPVDAGTEVLGRLHTAVLGWVYLSLSGSYMY